MISAGYFVLSILTHILGKPKALLALHHPSQSSGMAGTKPKQGRIWGGDRAGDNSQELMEKRSLRVTLELGCEGKSGCTFRILKGHLTPCTSMFRS